MNVEEFLEHKPLYYSEIDYTRMPRVYAKIAHAFGDPCVIHIIGTNGKGTTGRFLATALSNMGYDVGHYTSPHIVDFKERIWHNKESISTQELEEIHQKLFSLLEQKDRDSLSYFEYTTLLAMLYYKSCDFVVLEAGLGGEHDATAVFSNELTLVTPIAFDHEAFLGTSIEEIAATKLRAVQHNAILSKQLHREVYSVAQEIAQSKGFDLFCVEDLLQEEDLQKIQVVAKTQELTPYMQDNLSLAIAALHLLEKNYSVENFKDAKLFGRFTQIKERIFIDVGHNPLAAYSLRKTLKEQSVVLIYNSYSDKDYTQVLEILKPLITKVEIIAIEDQRIVQKEKLQKVLQELGINYKDFNTPNFIQNYEQSKEIYLVFGSFSVVEAFLKRTQDA